LHRPGLVDHAGTRNVRRDVRHAAHDRAFGEFTAQDLVLDDAVLQREHRGVGADDRLDAPCRALGIPELHRDDDQVRGPECRGIVARANLVHMDVALRLVLDGKPIALHRLEVRAACHERDVLTRARKPSAEETAHAARAHHHDSHRPDRTK
jgi:hypothetical protein